jgi:hypothetical protein
MDRSRLARLVVVLTAVAFLGGGCRDATGSVGSPSDVAGTYMIDPSTSRGVAAGTLVLSSLGTAERRVEYAPGTAPHVAIGTFQLHRDNVIRFALREDSGRSPYEWRPYGIRAPNRITITYPDAADGPDTVESYTRR